MLLVMVVGDGIMLLIDIVCMGSLGGILFCLNSLMVLCVLVSVLCMVLLWYSIC